MLTPEFLDGAPDEIIKLYQAVEDDILADMARRINTYDYWIPSAEHQRKKLQEMGMMQSEISKQLSKITGRSEAELKALILEAGEKTLIDDDAVYKNAGLEPVPPAESPRLKKVMNAGYKGADKELKNITRTTARTASKQFEDALDRAWFKIQTGAFDYETAITSAIKDLSSKGISSINYPTGHTDSIETAVRRAVMTGVNQTCAKVQDERANELGWDLVETSAHGGARPEHAEWQGKIFSRSGDSKEYPDFKSSTGYGTGAGLCGWNCRHSFRPYLKGTPLTYSKSLLNDYDAEKYSYNGNKINEYDARQKENEINRNIRRWQRETKSLKAAGKNADKESAKLAAWRDEKRNFYNQTKLKPK